VIKRHYTTKKFYNDAKQISLKTGKVLMVIGDPCGGNYFQFISDFFPNCEHGDITIDLFGCSKCIRMDINDMEAWAQFGDDSFVVMETGTLSFSKDIIKVLTQIKRVSGGDFLSAGGTHGYLWENFLHKTYDKNLNYITHPFDFREDYYHKSKTLVGKEVLELEFMKL
tara:strand:- start:88 stop:591 length:504 start_codon:yes stop_codon:yes gene_type:complete